MSRFLRYLLSVTLLTLCLTLHAASSVNEELLPFGAFPPLSGVVSEQRDVESLRKEMENLGSQVKDTVKIFASHRNLTCFNSPCLLQAFPLVYTKVDSGFFGGFRAKLTNISRPDPYLYSLETSVIRSDTQQWLTFLSGDFPRINFLPLKPRLKTRFSYSRTTETRFFGTGKSFDETLKRPDSDYRYSLNEIGAYATMIVPLFKLEQQKINAFGTINSVRHQIDSFSNPSSSKLWDIKPRAYEGGRSTRIGFGILLDSRDRELLTRQGWAMEFSTEYSKPPFGRYDFRRYSLIDRRYFSKGKFTLASRLTMDGITGKEPFWELASVGGIDPIFDISNSMILRGFYNGRFHERFKVIESAELRIELAPSKILGLLTQFIFIPTAVDLARLSDQNAVSFTTGVKMLFNRNFLVQTYASFSKDDKNVYLDFGQEF